MSTHNKQDKDDRIIKERRKHPRYAFLKSTFYSIKNKIYEGEIKDIDVDEEGVKGVFITTDEQSSLGEVITVAIPTSGKKTGKKLRGVIVRKQPGGFGVHFKSHLNE